MSDITTMLKESHAIVWKYRAELEPYWPTPNTEDALLFAFTELGEAVDAHLRSKPEYARNRDKDLSVLDELADCALMLLTALGNDYIFEWNLVFPPQGKHLKWDAYIVNMTLAIDHAGKDWEYTECLVARISAYPDMDLPARLTARLERIAAKRLPQKRIHIDNAYGERLSNYTEPTP